MPLTFTPVITDAYFSQGRSGVKTGDAFAEVHQLIGNPAVVHDGAGHDEERDGQHGEGLGGVHDLLQDGPGLDAVVDEVEVEEGRAKQGIHDGHAHEIQNEDQENRDEVYKAQCHQ